MIRFNLLRLIIIVSLLITPVSMSGADREHQQIMADIRMLQEQTVRLQLLMASLDEALQKISDKMDSQTDAARQTLVDQRLTLDSIGGGVRILREKLDDSNIRISSLSQEVEALRVSIPPTTQEFTELTIDPETGLPLETPLLSTVPVVGALSPGVSPRRMYDTAWADYTNGQWTLAIQGFEAYMKTFPRSEFTDDAQFYIGQTYYAEGKFEEAVQAFEQVVLNYPDGDILPEASYKRGLALDRLGSKDRAKQAFELIVQNFPDNVMATLAQQALNRLSQPE